MKTRIALICLAISILSGCAIPKPMYETRAGKKKLKHYNAIMYSHNKTARH